MPSEKQIKALQEFAKWAIRESAFQAASLDGPEVQEKALSLGLLEQTVFDPEIHGYNSDAEKGDWWFVFSSLLTAAEQAEPAPTDPCKHPVWGQDKDGTRVCAKCGLVDAPDRAAGAVKEIVEEVCEGWCKENGGRGSFIDCFGCRIHRDLTALEPAEPATDAEPVAWLMREQGTTVTLNKVQADEWGWDGKDIQPLFTRPPESLPKSVLERVERMVMEDREGKFNAVGVIQLLKQGTPTNE